MRRNEPTRHDSAVNDAWAIRVTAIYQRKGAVALTRSQVFDLTIDVQELLGWAKDLEDLGIEFVRLEIEVE